MIGTDWCPCEDLLLRFHEFIEINVSFSMLFFKKIFHEKFPRKLLVKLLLNSFKQKLNHAEVIKPIIEAFKISNEMHWTRDDNNFLIGKYKINSIFSSQSNCTRAKHKKVRRRQNWIPKRISTECSSLSRGKTKITFVKKYVSLALLMRTNEVRRCSV